MRPSRLTLASLSSTSIIGFSSGTIRASGRVVYFRGLLGQAVFGFASTLVDIILFLSHCYRFAFVHMHFSLSSLTIDFGHLSWHFASYTRTLYLHLFSWGRSFNSYIRSIEHILPTVPISHRAIYRLLASLTLGGT